MKFKTWFYRKKDKKDLNKKLYVVYFAVETMADYDEAVALWLNAHPEFAVDSCWGGEK